MARMPRLFFSTGVLLVGVCVSGCAKATPIRTVWRQSIGPSAAWRHLDAPLSPELVWHYNGKTIRTGRGFEYPGGYYGDKK